MIKLPIEIKSKNIEYLIKKDNSGTYTFQFNNNSIIPCNFTFYRYLGENDIILNNVEEIFFDWNQLRIINPTNSLEDYNLGVSCGTGLGLCSINSFEKFKKTYTYKDVLDKVSYESYISDFELKDKFYGEDIFSDKDRYIINPNSKLTNRDSLEIEFYRALHSYGKKEIFYIKSNTIKIGYLDVLQNYTEKELENKGKWNN